MAKTNRFPSEANVPKTGKKAALAVADEKAIEGKAQDLVQVEYKLENNHILEGVHALAKGVNHVPAHVWQKFSSHPAIMSMVKAGHIVPPDAVKVEAAPESEEKDEESGDGEESA